MLLLCDPLALFDEPVSFVLVIGSSPVIRETDDKEKETKGKESQRRLRRVRRDASQREMDTYSSRSLRNDGKMREDVRNETQSPIEREDLLGLLVEPDENEGRADMISKSLFEVETMQGSTHLFNEPAIIPSLLRANIGFSFESRAFSRKFIRAAKMPQGRKSQRRVLFSSAKSLSSTHGKRWGYRAGRRCA